jgi:glycosyltransferase involved in cell wall biosynthesis
VKILFALPGLHRVDRGAEIAFISIATELARRGDDVTLIGSGPHRPGRLYNFISVPTISRERFEHFPSLPLFRNETAWEDACFAPGLLRAFKPSDYDATLTCSYPFSHWVLRRPVLRGPGPAHIFVTQNGDWPAYSNKAEYRFFDCDGLVCTNPEYYDRNSSRYRCALIPNGVDVATFTPGPVERKRFGLPSGPLVLMVSALIPSKNVAEGIEAVAALPDAILVVAGDGPLRSQLQRLADERLPGRYRQLTIPAADMPALYRSADVFLHLSRDESFGNVFVEALACGIPVVAYDVPRTRWILGDTGFPADGPDPRSIGAHLSLALGARDKGTRHLVERAAQFDWRQIAAQYRQFLATVVEEKELLTGAVEAL